MIWMIAYLFLMSTPAEAFFHTPKVKDMEALHELACSSQQSEKGPWHLTNLYDCESRTFFVPYQLWSGAEWDGNKDAPCMHPANTTFTVVNNGRTRTITGPKEWKGKQIWSRENANGRKTQYFECHSKGIGRLWEVRDGREKTYRRAGRCKFPAGYGWEIGTRRRCSNTSVEIYLIELDGDHNLSALEFDWYRRTRSNPEHILRGKYRYEPNKGMQGYWPQNQ